MCGCTEVPAEGVNIMQVMTVSRTREVTAKKPTSFDVVKSAFYGVLGTREPYATSSGVEAFVGVHALNCYN